MSWPRPATSACTSRAIRLLQFAARQHLARTRIRNLVFVGIATNVCVRSTLRDGFHLEYFGILLEDASHQIGPDFIKQASIYNIETFFGWVSTVRDFKRLAGSDPAA
jgi:nicotinamidase-related amidase